jgi:hypothetical protein
MNHHVITFPDLSVRDVYLWGNFRQIADRNPSVWRLYRSKSEMLFCKPQNLLHCYAMCLDIGGDDVQKLLELLDKDTFITGNVFKMGDHMIF